MLDLKTCRHNRLLSGPCRSYLLRRPGSSKFHPLDICTVLVEECESASEHQNVRAPLERSSGGEQGQTGKSSELDEGHFVDEDFG